MAGQNSNLSCLLYGPHEAKFEDREVPGIQDPHDVVIRIAYVGVCGSDVSKASFPCHPLGGTHVKKVTRDHHITKHFNNMIRFISGITAASVSRSLRTTL